MYVVPVLGIHEDPWLVEQSLEQLKSNGSVASPGYAMPEGVVVYHAASGQLFKVLLENDNVPKGNGLKE